jgi:aspartate racemase
MAVNSDPRVIGLVGGLGVGAAVHYYRELAAAHERDGRPFELVMVHAQMSRVFEHASAGDLDGLARYLAGILAQLKSAGASLAVIPAMTPHLCIDQLTPIAPLPIVDLIEVVVRALAERGVRRVALFGTRFVVQSDLFGRLKGIEVARPRPDEITFIHDTYTQLARTGTATDAQYRQLVALADTLQQRDGAESIVLAGTDLASLFNDTNTPFPHLDCAGAHIRAIMRP